MWARQYSTLKLIGHPNNTCVVYMMGRDEALTRLMTGNEETAKPTPRRDEALTRLMEEAMCGHGNTQL